MLLRSDLKCVLGGSKTLLANTFLHMLETLYTKYKARLADLTFFEPVMPQCVAMLNALCQQHNNMDMPHDGLIGFVDGHFQVRYKPEPCPPQLTMRHYGMRSALLPQKHHTAHHTGHQSTGGRRMRASQPIRHRCLQRKSATVCPTVHSSLPTSGLSFSVAASTCLSAQLLRPQHTHKTS